LISLQRGDLEGAKTTLLTNRDKLWQYKGVVMKLEAWGLLPFTYPSCICCWTTVKDYYMVKNEIWRRATLPEERVGQMHWACLRERLAESGYELTKGDLSSAPVNEDFVRENPTLR
jgi:hypothetical protein